MTTSLEYDAVIQTLLKQNRDTETQAGIHERVKDAWTNSFHPSQESFDAPLFSDEGDRAHESDLTDERYRQRQKIRELYFSVPGHRTA